MLLKHNKLSGSHSEFRDASGTHTVIYDRSRRPPWVASWPSGVVTGGTFDELVRGLSQHSLGLRFAGSDVPRNLELTIGGADVARHERHRSATRPAARPQLPAPGFLRRMERAKTADEGRGIIRDHEEAVNALEREMGLGPTVGEGGSGFRYCGFSALDHRERQQLLKRAAAVDATAGEKMRLLVEEGLAFAEPWKRLLEIEMRRTWPRPAFAFGRECEILVPGEARSYLAVYALREICELYPSHDGVSFRPSEEYEHANDRDYTRNIQAERVMRHAAQFEPAFLLSDNPDAVNGPPITDHRGNVLGGNSRAMVLQRVYEGGRGDVYRAQLAGRLAQFGLDPAEFKRLRRPVLVRQIPKHSLADAQQAISDFNKVGTAALTAAERALVDARSLSAETLDYLAEQVAAEGEEASLAKVLAGPRGPKIVARLVEDGVIAAQDRASYLDERGLVTPEGRQRIARLAVGRLFETPADFEAAAPELRAKLERVVGVLARLDRLEGWGLMGPAREALSALTEARGRGLRSLDDLAAQQGLWSPGGRYSPEAIALAKALQLSPVRAAAAFRQYRRDAELATGGVLAIITPPTPSEAFAAAFPP